MDGGSDAAAAAAATKVKPLTTAQRRRLKKKRAKAKARAEAAKKEAAAAEAASAGSAGVSTNGGGQHANGSSSGSSSAAAAAAGVEIEYVRADPLETAGEVDGDGTDEFAEEFRKQFGAIFEKFTTPQELMTGKAPKTEEELQKEAEEAAAKKAAEEAAAVKKEDGDSDSDDDKPLTRSQRKAKRLTPAQLKSLVNRPDLVEAHDVTAADPQLLLHLKGYRHTVAVPRHWSAKRKYLQGKRGIEKAPFTLPDFIQHTGIAKIRDAIQEQDDKKTSKQRARDRVAPKMGKINIDYQILHDAFFKFQTKPQLSKHGDIYYEGKEFELKFTDKKAGFIGETLREALGIRPGAPPPWLINMQRYGPPPAYPTMKIPGLNAPIPPGASYGYQPGGWGRPPVDERGLPLYGDAFGTAEADSDEGIDKAHWGDMVSEESESEEESSEEEEEEAGEAQGDGTETPVPGAGTETPLVDGASTVTTDLGTPATIELRKGLRKGGLETPETPQLYKVLEVQNTSVGADQLMGSSHRYVLPGQAASGGAAGAGVGAAAGAGADANLNPDQLAAKLQAQYGDGVASAAMSMTTPSEAEESRKRKRRAEQEAEADARKRQREFKF